MKITKSELKALVKECLVEILNEGLSSPARKTSAVAREGRAFRDRDAEPLPHMAAARASASPDPAAVRRRTMDLVEHSPKRQELPSRTAPVSKQFGQITRDPMMAAIFADTAATTLVEQSSTTPAAGGDAAARAAASLDPTDLFGDDKMDAWNRAAFAPSRPGLSSQAIALLTAPDDPR